MLDPKQPGELLPEDREPTHDDPEIAKRRVKSLDLKIAGLSYRQIAKETGVSLSVAYEDVQSELTLLNKSRQAKAEAYRELSLRKLDRWTLALTPKAKNGDVLAIRELIKIEERRAKLLGLDMPTKVAATTPDGERAMPLVVKQLSTEAILLVLRDTEPVPAESVTVVPEPITLPSTSPSPSPGPEGGAAPADPPDGEASQTESDPVGPTVEPESGGES
jgi:hypothetical protein